MLHVSPHQVAGSEGTAQRQLTGEGGSSDDTGQAAGIVSRVGGVRTSDPEHVEHSALGFENGATTKSSNLQRGHGHGNLQGSIEAEAGLAKELEL